MKVLQKLFWLVVIGLLIVWFRDWAMIHPIRAVSLVVIGLIATQTFGKKVL